MVIFTKPINCPFQIRSDKVEDFLCQRNKHTALLALERAKKHQTNLKDGKGIIL